MAGDTAVVDDATVPLGSTESAPAPAASGSAPDSSLNSITSPPIDTGPLVKLQEQKIDASGKLYDTMSRTLDNDLVNLRKKADVVGVEAGNLKPWNHDEEVRKRQVDPIESFGSLGSVFGILASAFTGQPFSTAMDASAAAMNAITEGKSKDFDRAYKAWQDNTKIALERHKIQHDAYTTASQLLTTNMAASKAKIEVLASRFGDEKTLFLLQNGMDKELFSLMESRQKLALDIAEKQPKIWLENLKMSDLLARGYNPKDATSDNSKRALQGWQQDWNGRKYDEDVDFTRKWWGENPDGTSDDFAQAYTGFREKLGGARGSSRIPKPDEVEIKRRTDQYVADGMSPAEAFDRATREIKTAGAAPSLNRQQTAEIERRASFYENEGGLTKEEAFDRAAREVREAAAANRGSARVPKPEEAEINRRVKQYVADGMSESEAYTKAVQEVKRSAVTPSGNRQDDLTGKIDRITNMETTIGKVEELLKKHKAITGLGGKVTRPAEIVGNIFGSNDTDRKQFERWISELQEWGPQALNDRNGRPLASEVGKISNIIAGLAVGDTTANTARAYHELRQLLATLKKQLGARKDPAAPGAAAPPPAEPPKAPGWKSAPVVGGDKRSDIEAEEMTG